MTKTTSFRPYHNDVVNLEYNRLFCDDIGLYRDHPEEFQGENWAGLLAVEPALTVVRKLAENDELPARLRILAFNYLLAKHLPAARQELLGFILEAGVDDGLETLAAYTDYSLLFIDCKGTKKQWDGLKGGWRARMVDCFRSAASLAEQLTPTDQPRFPPPFSGMARITLLLSDGRYFGQGPGNNLTKDRLSGPLIRQANALLANLIDGDSSN